MLTPSHRRLHTVLACLAMLMHVLGMPALVNASAETRLAYGIAGHCLTASSEGVADSLLDSDHSHHVVQLVAQTPLAIEDLPESSTEPGTSCCCASVQLILALPAASATHPSPPPKRAHTAQTDSLSLALRERWPAINPRASPVPSRIA